MKIAVVGAGPAGSVFAWHAARDGACVTLFDPSHPREKPCGGGLTARTLALLPPAPPEDPLPARRVERCLFDSGQGEIVDVRLSRAVAVAARSELDAWLVRRALEAGARLCAERVTSLRVEAAAVHLQTAAGTHASADLLVGADGAGSLVRRTLLQPTPTARLTMALGWYAPGEAPMTVRFTPGIEGYAWLFPRRDHVGVGICAPLARWPTRELAARLEREVARHYPALAPEGATRRYAHTIPSPAADPHSIFELGGARWALLGDAGALADPLTGEGIYFALRSAAVLAETLRADASAARYPARAWEDFGRELLEAVRLRARFFAPGFARRMVRCSARSTAVREVLGDLVLGDQGYLCLKRRLWRALPQAAWQLVRGSARV